MKILILYRLIRCIAIYHILSCLVVLLVVELDGASGKSEVKTKLLLQNIRTRLAQKADEIVKKRECESGFILCKNIKSKESEGDEEKSEEIRGPPKPARGQHKPTIRVNPKDVTQTLIPKAHKHLFRKSLKLGEAEGQTKVLDSPEDSDEDETKHKSDEKTQKKGKMSFTDTKKPVTIIKKPSQTVTQSEQQIRKSPDEKQPKVLKEDLQDINKIGKIPVAEKAKNITRRDATKDVPQATTPIQKEKEIPKKTTVTVKEVPKMPVKVDKVKEVPKMPVKVDKVKELAKNIKDREKAVDKKKEEKAEIKEKGKEKKTDLREKPVKEEVSVFLPLNSFIFVLDPGSVGNSLCEKHSQIYLKQLKKYQIWALMMYDASAKFPSGILQGNANQYGDFDECLAINAVFKNVKDKSKKRSGIKGKYCLATVDVSSDSDNKNLEVAVERAESFRFIKSTTHDPGHFIPRFSTIHWGMCVPSECHAENVEIFLKSRLEAFINVTGLRFDVDVDEGNCLTKDDLNFEFETETAMVIGFYLVMLGISLCATLLDKKEKIKILSEQEQIERELEEASRDITAQPESVRQRVHENGEKNSLKGKIKQILMAFSLKKNAGKLLSDGNKAGIHCINGIKSIFTVMLYFAHKTIPLGMSPFSNRVFLTKISNQPITILLRASIIYTDSFLLISGVLTSYNLAKEISEKRKISWARKTFARFIRLTPALLAVVLFYAYVWDRLGSGPVWNLLIRENASLCRKYMWRNLLYIQNLFAFEDMCAPQTHQLALDMQLSLLAPLFVHLMHTYDKAGVGILQAIFILSSIMRYITASNNNLSVVIYHGMSVSQLYETANLLYGQTFHRASPYILGVVVGYYLNKFEKSFEMPKAFAALGWILSFTFGFYSVVSPSPMATRAYRYDVQEAAQYAALSPVAWSLALSWLIVACHLGYGGFLNNFLCRKIFLVFSRISYSVYLTQFLVFFYNVGVTRIPELFTITGSINVTEFLIVIGISVIVTLLFDIPMMDIKKIILDKADPIPIIPMKPEVDVQNDHEEQSAEVSEAGSEGLSREDSQEATEEILEPIEDEGEYEYEGEEQEDVDIEEEEGELEEENEGNPDEEIDNEEVAEVFDIQPLRRSTRMHFSDESEDTKVFKSDPESEDEQK